MKAAVEEVGLAADWHPGWCRHRRHDDGRHRSVTFTVGQRRIWATADVAWRVTVHESGAGPLSADGAAYREAIRAYLTDPAVRRS